MTALAPGTMVVSCQAGPGNPLDSPAAMALMAQAAEAGGAGAIRANGPADIAAIRAVTSLPIIGLHKLGDPAGVFITPTYEAAAGVVAAGADLVALDGTLRPRPDGQPLDRQIRRIHDELGVPVLADVDSLDAGLAARDAGADLVATTLSGYTVGSVRRPDLMSNWSAGSRRGWTARSSPRAGSAPPRTSVPSATRARTPSSSATRSPTRRTSPPAWSARFPRGGSPLRVWARVERIPGCLGTQHRLACPCQIKAGMTAGAPT